MFHPVGMTTQRGQRCCSDILTQTAEGPNCDTEDSESSVL